MIQGTTPTHKFNIDIKTDLIAGLRVVYEQNGKVVLRKEKEDCALADYAITTRLTQEETLLFTAPGNVRIQLHALTTGGDAFASKPISVPVYILLDKAVI